MYGEAMPRQSYRVLRDARNLRNWQRCGVILWESGSPAVESSQLGLGAAVDVDVEVEAWVSKFSRAWELPVGDLSLSAVPPLLLVLPPLRAAGAISTD